VTQIPIISGVYADTTADFRVSYPVNFTPTPRETGISQGYLRPSDGIVSNGTGPGLPRGGIVWRDVAYRVMGTSLVSVSSTGGVMVLGDVGAGGQCAFDYSFDRLAITSGGRLYYWDGLTLEQVTDTDLGTALTVIWVDGYFMTTDGEFLVVTELLDPFAVNPLKYGSSEADPDPVVALIKLRNEVYALNRNTIEVFFNVGGDLFPFQRQDSAQIQKGCIGTFACCEYLDAVAFLGSGRNESPGIYVAANANAIKVSTQEIDQLLLAYSEAELAAVVLERRNDRSHDLLYVHLPDRCLVYDGAASKEMQRPVWHVLTTSLADFAQYRGRDFLWCYDRWNVADPTSTALGVLSRDVASHWGQVVRWEFATAIVYNEGRGAIVAGLELVALTGSAAFGVNPTIGTSYTVDGVNWSQERFINAGVSGERAKRLAWFWQGSMRNWRAQRFRGTSQGPVVVARLEAALEPLAF
jgi:hypothetical protein